MQVELQENFEVKNHTALKIGGKIKEVYFPLNCDEFLQIVENEQNTRVFGNFSNTLVSSGGYDGAVIITSKMNNIEIKGAKVTVECGVKGPMLSQKVSDYGLSGFEFMIGFPGSIGGNICMNASAHGQSVSDRLISVQCYSKEKGIYKLSKEKIDFAYRSSKFQTSGEIILSAEFMLEHSTPQDVKEKMQSNLDFRKNHQPSMIMPNCGSIFRNPEGQYAGMLLEMAGAKNLKYGGARVWENHANFIVNDGDAASEDVIDLMLDMQNSVKEKFDIKLKPEIKYLGNEKSKEAEKWNLMH